MISESSRYRGLRGGLDNAIKQAEDRGLHDMLIIDSDCHQQEPFTAFAKYCDEPYKSLILAKDPEADPYLARLVKSAAIPYGPRHSIQESMKGIKLIERPETSWPHYWYPPELVEVFTKIMHDIGIKKSIVMPNHMLGLPHAKPDFEVRITRAYIEYMLDNFLGKYPEILALLCVPTNSPEKAAELIDDVGSENGIAGIMIPCSARTLAGSDEFDPIYEAAQSKRLAISFHGGLHKGAMNMGLEQFEFVGYHALAFPLSVIRHLTSLVLAGVPVRFPNLRFAFMEGGVTWIPWMMNRLDDEYTKRRLEAPLLSKLPSEYMKEFYYTSQPLEQSHKDQLEQVFRIIGAESHLMYASDYPHQDFDVPSVIYDLPFLSEAAKRSILGENAVRFFDLH